MDGKSSKQHHHIKVFVSTAVTACLLACAIPCAFAQTETIAASIDRMNVGRQPPGFLLANTGLGSDGAWAVVADSNARGKRAIEQASTDALEDSLRFYRVVAGKRQQLDGSDLSITPNEWHSLGVRAEGNRFVISYDGKSILSVVDTAITDAGGVGFWTKADSIARFDEMSVTPLPKTGK
jgi:hypothetical protein